MLPLPINAKEREKTIIENILWIRGERIELLCEKLNINVEALIHDSAPHTATNDMKLLEVQGEMSVLAPSSVVS